MVNNMTSKCKNCVVLIRLLVLDNLRHNQRVSVKYVTSKNNFLADYLSRLKIGLFKRQAPYMKEQPDKITEQLWPLSKLWVM